MRLTDPFLQPLAKRPVWRPVSSGCQKNSKAPKTCSQLPSCDSQDKGHPEKHFAPTHKMTCLWLNQNGNKTTGIGRERGTCIRHIERKHASCDTWGLLVGAKAEHFRTVQLAPRKEPSLRTLFKIDFPNLSLNLHKSPKSYFPTEQISSDCA